MIGRWKKTSEPKKIQELLNNTASAFGQIEVENGLNIQVPFSEAIGTYGQGTLDVDYDTLKQLFGKPVRDSGKGRDCKVRKEWVFSIDGVVCTVYDWKQGYDYTRPKGGLALRDTEWSVGGSHPICKRLVQGVIDSYRIRGE